MEKLLDLNHTYYNMKINIGGKEKKDMRKDIDSDIAEARLMEHKAVWSALRFHRKRINHVIENILNA